MFKGHDVRLHMIGQPGHLHVVGAFWVDGIMTRRRVSSVYIPKAATLVDRADRSCGSGVYAWVVGVVVSEGESRPGGTWKRIVLDGDEFKTEDGEALPSPLRVWADSEGVYCHA